MRVFGSRCWYVVPKKDVQKLNNARTREALMKDYSSRSKGYIYIYISYGMLMLGSLLCHEM